MILVRLLVLSFPLGVIRRGNTKFVVSAKSPREMGKPIIDLNGWVGIGFSWSEMIIKVSSLLKITHSLIWI